MVGGSDLQLQGAPSPLRTAGDLPLLTCIGKARQPVLQQWRVLMAGHTDPALRTARYRFSQGCCAGTHALEPGQPEALTLFARFPQLGTPAFPSLLSWAGL